MSERSVELAPRVERLERNNRRLVRFGGGALGLLGGALLLSMAPICKTVRAERFVLEDARGTERARMTAYETGGTPLLVFYGPDGKDAATLSIDDEGQAFLALRGDGDGPLLRLCPDSATIGGSEPARRRRDGDDASLLR